MKIFNLSPTYSIMYPEVEDLERHLANGGDIEDVLNGTGDLAIQIRQDILTPDGVKKVQSISLGKLELIKLYKHLRDMGIDDNSETEFFNGF